MGGHGLLTWNIKLQLPNFGITNNIEDNGQHLANNNNKIEITEQPAHVSSRQTQTKKVQQEPQFKDTSNFEDPTSEC